MNEETFRNWAIKTVKNRQTINNYIKYLKNDLPNKLNRNSILDEEDIDILENIYKKCSKNNDLYEWNRTIYTGGPMAAIGKYIDFIKNKNNNKFIEQNKNFKYIEIKNIILYGVPGVGKTYSHKKLIDMIEDRKYNENEIFSNLENHNKTVYYDEVKKENRVKFITFHQSFGYEDFIEGFRPNKEGHIKLQDGVFKDFCEKAKESDENFYFVIDEINRANISKVFGELITLIEEDKRENLSVTLPYSKKPFSIPKNLYIIGTMNSTDKSIALIDIALRRRFAFLKMKPNPELVKDKVAKKIMEDLNNKINNSILGEDYQIGHNYFMGIKDKNDLSFTCKYKIKPLLEEYFYGDKEGFDKVFEVIKDVCEA